MLEMGRTKAPRGAHRKLHRVLRTFALASLIGWAAVSAAACNTTPTLPLPPPIAIAEAPDEQGFALVRGEAKSRSYVSILNERTDQGVITRADDEGKWEARIAARIGDSLTVWQEIDGEAGEPNFIEVMAPR